MACWPLSRCKSFKYWLLMSMMIAIFLVQVQGGCIEEERETLLEIKASFNSHVSAADYILPTWADDGGGKCCDWERVKCNTTTGHVTQLSLDNLSRGEDENYDYLNKDKIWPLNVSLFLHFEELRSLNLSYSYLDNGIVNTGLERLSSLKKLEMLDLGWNRAIDNHIIPSLGALTSLRILDLSHTGLEGYFPANEFATLENLEMLDLSACYFNGTFQMQGFERSTILWKLKTLNLGFNRFNNSLLTSLSALPLLKVLDLHNNQLSGSFPAQELAHLSNLEKLDLSFNGFDSISTVQGCEGLSRLKRLEKIDLSANNFNMSIISCLSALPSLKILDLTDTHWSKSSFPIQELSGLRELEALDLSFCRLDSAFNFNGTMNRLVHSKDFLRSLAAFPSLRFLSLRECYMGGVLSTEAFCELKNLQELDLSGNDFEGNLPLCFSSLSSLKRFDISSNRFTGIILPSLIASLTSLEYIDFSHNKFEGSLSFSSFSNHTKLEVVRFASNDVDTEQPSGWVPMFQLKELRLSNCNMNRHTGRVVPGFLLHQHKLQALDLSHNSLEGQLPLWLIKNNTMLVDLQLRNNSFGGSIMPLYKNINMRRLDMSGNHIVGTIQGNILKFLPILGHLNLSGNALSGAIPSSIGDLTHLSELDLSDNKFSGEVPKGLLTNCSNLVILILSKNKLHGQILSGNISLGMTVLLLDGNYFTGKIVNETDTPTYISMLDISNNLFSGVFPGWICNMSIAVDDTTLVVRNNRFEGRFPCGTALFSFLDISQNSFSGSIPSCLSRQVTKHLHLGSNRFTGSIPQSFRKLTDLLTLDMGNNKLSGKIPSFLGELSSLRILILRENKFSGSMPKELCRLSNVSLIDLSSNSLSGSIPTCLKNITGPTNLDFVQTIVMRISSSFSYKEDYMYIYEKQNEVEFITKNRPDTYKGSILDLMSGLDFSCNNLKGVIPKELGLLNHIRAMNLSHNQLIGHIPSAFSHLENIESLDLSSNNLSGRIPSELIQLNFLSDFVVSGNNLSGRLPEMKAQFATFNATSYVGNPFLCGPPLEKKCTSKASMTVPLAEEGTEKWYDTDMTWFYESFISGWATFLLGFAAFLYTNPYWRRRWLDFIDECMYTSYFFFCDLVRKLSMLLYN